MVRASELAVVRSQPASADVVVVIPVFNRAAMLIDALDAVAAQTLPPRRVVVVDDGSSDRPKERIDQWLTRSTPAFAIDYIEQAHRGVSSARNRGLEAAGDARYIAFLDSDDLWPEDFLQQTVTALEGDPEAVAVSGGQRFLDCESSAETVKAFHETRILTPVWILRANGSFGSGSLFRTAAVRRHHGFDETMMTGQDLALFLSISVNGRWLNRPDCLVTYRRNHARRSGSADHICHIVAEPRLAWAQIREDFITRQNGAKVVEPAFYRRMLARAWYKAGREAIANRAHRCGLPFFVTSLRWQIRFKPLVYLCVAAFLDSLGSREPAQ